MLKLQAVSMHIGVCAEHGGGAGLSFSGKHSFEFCICFPCFAERVKERGRRRRPPPISSSSKDLWSHKE